MERNHLGDGIMQRSLDLAEARKVQLGWGVPMERRCLVLIRPVIAPTWRVTIMVVFVSVIKFYPSWVIVRETSFKYSIGMEST